MFLIFLCRPMLLAIWAIGLSANVNSPLGDRLFVRYHSGKNIPLNGAFKRSPIWKVRVAAFLDMGGLPAPITVSTLPPIVFTPATERVAINFLWCHTNTLSLRGDTTCLYCSASFVRYAIRGQSRANWPTHRDIKSTRLYSYCPCRGPPQ